jgi:hypothetical protein
MSVAESKELVALLDDILDECEDDHVGLWSVVREVRSSLANVPSDDVKDVTLELLKFLLHRGLIEAGYPAANGTDFEPWGLSADEAIARIDREWSALGHEPNIGEVVWFTSRDQAE